MSRARVKRRFATPCERVRLTCFAQKSYEGIKRTGCFAVSELLVNAHCIPASKQVNLKTSGLRFNLTENMLKTELSKKNIYYGYALCSLSVFDQKNWYVFQFILSSLDQKYLTQHVQNSTYFSLSGLMWTGLEINVHAWGLRALHDSRQSGCKGD